ncbi:hypothetical protein SAMN05421693_10233 [Ectothiorhodospira magna]|uniref:Uncharacterized protein n=1 Tax=Ectothiorhodospira magna TaxID=867345 RepID=A0A1H8Z9W2_9GAMM|nr:DsrE/DsrF/DrsH-like family protein [Ectothiorhodospira magna]SEP61220.1 hypothetical protein SAMN05421693_10233 [Ectothiorhodospira magna]
MADKVIIMLLNTSLQATGTLGTPFFHAAVAAAMDLEVEIYFAAETAQLLKRGVAENLYAGKQRTKSIYEFMQDAHEAGVKFYACTAAMAEHGLNDDNVIPELDGKRGGAAFIGEAVEDGVVVLTY